MYDISQLNDMLVPELKDIADQLSIPHAQKTDKQDLIFKILDRQPPGDGADKEAAPERRKRKRISKTNTLDLHQKPKLLQKQNPMMKSNLKKKVLKMQDQSAGENRNFKKMIYN